RVTCIHNRCIDSMKIFSIWRLISFNRGLLYVLLICNLLGTVYWYIWYGSQMSATPSQFIPFVPDSPTASSFLCIAILALIVNKNLPTIEALAFVTLIKYGVWAVIMNIILFIQYDMIT